MINNIMDKYFEYLDFPKVPTELLEDLKVIENKPKESLGRHLHKPDGDPQTRVYYPAEVDINLVKWLKKNIFYAEKFMFVYIIHLEPLIMHRDIMSYTYLYLLQHGGEKLNNCAVIDDKMIDVRFDLHRWVKLNTHILHGTRGEMTEKRISLQAMPYNAYEFDKDPSLYQRINANPKIQFM